MMLKYLLEPEEISFSIHPERPMDALWRIFDTSNPERFSYKFVSWSGSQDSIDSLLQSNNQSANQISVTTDISLNAHFVPENYTISVSSGTGGMQLEAGVLYNRRPNPRG